MLLATDYAKQNGRAYHDPRAGLPALLCDFTILIMTYLSQQFSSRLTSAAHRRACPHGSFQHKGLLLRSSAHYPGLVTTRHARQEL